MIDQYYLSGSLPEEASTYVKREADDELYEGLKAGIFCYVLNSSQSGKSSLRVRTMRCLREEGVKCASIDLSRDTECDSQEQWYKGLVKILIKYFELDVKFEDWWKQNQSYSVTTRFQEFLEKILLTQIKENIVIFIDEIGSVLSFNFSTDNFFTFIRYCYNQRVDNPEYNRLTFCLLGIASPSDLIKDKSITAFNIGKAIFLKPFQLHEVEPLKKGLQRKYSNSEVEVIIQKILEWTGGQPFLTQKLCKLMVESQEENPFTVEQVVRDRIIENWDWPSQDDPQHLRTIRNRILTNKRAAELLELYQNLHNESGIIADDTPEQYDLQLSGLVVRQENKLTVYNPIYKEIFDKTWIETQLWELCPYAEDLKGWVASGHKDNSWLLRGNKLQEAQKWSKDKSLSNQHIQFLSFSTIQEEKEKLALLEIEAELAREKKNKAAVEKINQVLAEANKKAKKRILLGSIFLGLTCLLVVITGNLTLFYSRTVDKRDERIVAIKNIFYDQLKDQLEENDWEAADQTTRRIMWEIAGTQEERRFAAEVARNFPCEDLRKIDDLWTRYSNNHFGFSVQGRIWQSSEVDRDLGKFMSRVGWGEEKQEDGKAIIYFYPVTNFSRNAPEGQLPWLVTWEGSDGISDRIAYLNRIVSCGI